MIYLISFNPNFLYTAAQIHNHITTMSGVLDWWHYQYYMYLVDTYSLNPTSITNSIRAQFPSLTFFVVKVDLTEHGGLLPRDAWDWINRKTGYITPLKRIMSPLRSKQFSSPNPSAIGPLEELLKLLGGLKKGNK